ncbi:MAG: flagellar M-ring protein FliF [Dehalococcoidia bacterium]|nr:flagellar M-ring protein FliF [Dehalococcoidia bacterium]
MGARSTLAPILDRWNQLPRARQFALAGILAGTIVVLYFVFIASSSPNLVVAYSGLQPEDSAAIADQLEKDGVHYEIGGGGSTISVPANRVAETRIKLAQAGLPKGSASTGLEIFDKTNFGATDFVQQVNYQRGLEGELARSINTLDGVKASRVHIVIPKEAIFKEDQARATASVLLQLKPGARLTQDQVRGITNLVANSIQGLTQAGVTIIDETGHVLFDGASLDSPFSTGASASQLELQRQYETALQRDVEQTLARVVGQGRSAVTVRAKLNFDTVKTSADTFGSASSVVPRSTTSTTETFSGSNLNVGGVPGTGTNGATTAGSAANGNSTYSRTDTTTNNEIPKTTTTTIKAPGSVERLSVSVVLDDSVTGAQESSLTSAVAAAVGLDQTRGDTLSVTRLPFDPSVKEDLVPAAGEGVGQYLSYLKLLLPMLAVVLGFILVLLLLRSLARRQAGFPPAYQRALAAAAVPAALPPSQPLPALNAAPDPSEERIFRLAEANPRAVADVVQTWIREEEH